MRSLASLYFFLHLMNYLMFTIHLIPLSESYTVVSILHTGCRLMVAIIHPYKKSFMNSIDSLILANIGLIALLLDKYSGQDNGSIFGTIYLFVASFMATLPMVVMIGFVSYKFIKKSIKWISTLSIKERFCCLQKNVEEANNQINNSGSQKVISNNLELPDHVLHPEEYTVESNQKEITLQ